MQVSSDTHWLTCSWIRAEGTVSRGLKRFWKTHSIRFPWPLIIRRVALAIGSQLNAYTARPINHMAQKIKFREWRIPPTIAVSSLKSRTNRTNLFWDRSELAEEPYGEKGVDFQGPTSRSKKNEHSNFRIWKYHKSPNVRIERRRFRSWAYTSMYSDEFWYVKDALF